MLPFSLPFLSSVFSVCDIPTVFALRRLCHVTVSLCLASLPKSMFLRLLLSYRRSFQFRQSSLYFSVTVRCVGGQSVASLFPQIWRWGKLGLREIALSCQWFRFLTSSVQSQLSQIVKSLFQCLMRLQPHCLFSKVTQVEHVAVAVCCGVCLLSM